MEWQPIVTAPKDGTPFLGIAIGQGWEAYNIVRWVSHKSGNKGNFKGQCGGLWAPDKWMPLPAPPIDTPA